MHLDSQLQELLDKAANGEGLIRAEVLDLMEIKLNSPGYYALIHAADHLTRQTGEVGHVFAQVGIYLAPCPANDKKLVANIGDIGLEEAQALRAAGAAGSSKRRGALRS
ncbi:MAG: hypothetical protein M1598_08510 [Actinobacteria bacterium]|nr:hypothetical protein [Bacillota bacterium]MCL5046810.1 hypothetical protein [Actinomycetota bacterium]